MQAPQNLGQWIPRLFLVAAFIGSLCCFCRADYNLPLFVFAYMAWGLQRSQKSRIAWLIVITLVGDIIWLLYWAPFWSSDKYEEGYWENGIHTFVIILSVINLFVKAIILFLMHTQDTEVQHALTLDYVKESASSFLRQ